MIILKQGFITDLFKRVNGAEPVDCEVESEEGYNMRDLLSERTGDFHNEILFVAGAHMIEKGHTGKFTVWFMCDDDAEPWSSYRNLGEAKEALAELESLS